MQKMELVLLIVLISPVTAKVLKVDCQNTTTVVGKSATITCTFSTNVSPVERPFLVTRSPLDSAKFPELVVDCKNGHCSPAKGYRYTERTGSQQIIEIPSAEKRFEGIYQCQYDTPEPQELTPCTLLVQEFVVETPENSTPVSPETEGPSGDSEGKGVIVPAVVVPIVVVLALVVAFIVRKRLSAYYDRRFRPSKCPAKEKKGSDDSMEYKTPLNTQDARTVDPHGEDGSCVDRSQQHAETEAKEGDKKSSADSLLNSAHQNPRIPPVRSTGNERDTEPLALDTPTDNYQDHSPNEEKTSADGLPDVNRPNPTTTPAFSTGIAKTTLKPQDACAVNIHGKDGSCVDRSRSTGCVRKEQDAEPLASDTPTDNYQDNSPNEEKTSADGLLDVNRPNPTTTPAFSTGIAKTALNQQDACAINIHGNDGSCVDRSRSTGYVRKEQDAEPLALDTPTDSYQDNSPNEEKTSVDGLPNAKRQNPATTPAFSTGIADNPQHKVDIATDEDPSRNSACVSSPVDVSPKPEEKRREGSDKHIRNWRQTQTRHMPDLGMGIQELPSKHGVLLLTAQTKAELGGIVDAHYLFHYSGMTRQE